MRDGTALLKAGHQRSRQVFVRDGTALLKAGHQSPRQDSYAGWDRLAESGASEVSPGCAGWDRLAESGASEPSPGLF